MSERFRRGLNGLLVLLILGALAYASALLFGWNCPIKYLAGVPCPSCGLSRALAALLRLDFRTALRFHPMVFVLPPVVLYALFGKKPLFGSKNLERMLLWSVIVLDIAIWLIRLALHDPLIFLRFPARTVLHGSSGFCFIRHFVQCAKISRKFDRVLLYFFVCTCYTVAKGGDSL